jgi:hypothetical protein
MPDEGREKIVSNDYVQEGFIPEFAPDLRATIAQAIHEVYRRSWRNKLPKHDPSIAKWDKLPDYLKESNYQQADHIFEKLRRIGCAVHKVTNRNIKPLTFTEDEIEIMAEMEHARWNAERLRDGWEWSKERDVRKKTSPDLVPWSQLPEATRDWDRQTVRKIPEYLAGVGLEVRRQS